MNAVALSALLVALGSLHARSAHADEAAASPLPLAASPPSSVTLPPVLTGPPGALVGSPPASAVTPPAPERRRLEWDPRWHRFRPLEYATTAATGVAAISVFLCAKPSNHPMWVGPILFDEPVRNLLRLRTRSGLQTALDASFVVALVTPTQSLVDSIVLPAADGNLDLAWQLALMDAQAYALSGLITAGLYDSIGRARPSYADCQSGTSVDPLCGVGEYASFPSGHTSAAMTGAGLICAHHGALPLYGGAWTSLRAQKGSRWLRASECSE